MRNHVGLLAALCCFSSLLVTARTQHIETVPSKTPYYNPKERNVDLLCRADKPIEQCRVRLPGPSSETYDVGSLPSGVQRIGDQTRGECGIRLAQINSERTGKFVCFLTIGGQEHEASIEVHLKVSPRPTELKISKHTPLVDGGIPADSMLKAKCVSRLGLPVANITWMLDDVPLDETVLRPAAVTSELVDGQLLMTIQQEVNMLVTKDLNGKSLICVAQHIAWKKNTQRSIFPLSVKFAPEEIPHIHINELPASGSATVNITIHANPQPVTRWTVNGRLIKEGESVDIYQAYIPRPTKGNAEYTVLLKNNDCAKERASLFQLEATNFLGTQTYIIKAVRVDAEGTDVDVRERNDVEDSNNGATFWLISVWTFFCSVIATRLL